MKKLAALFLLFALCVSTALFAVSCASQAAPAATETASAEETGDKVPDRNWEDYL